MRRYTRNAYCITSDHTVSYEDCFFHYNQANGQWNSDSATPQPGMVSICDAFYFVKQDEGCQAIADKNGITLVQFFTWNPEAGGSSCSGLWADVWACISIIGHTPSGKSTSTQRSSSLPPTSMKFASMPKSRTSSLLTPMLTSCTGSHPDPTQGGSICKCKKWYLPAENEFCRSLASLQLSSMLGTLMWGQVVGATEQIVMCVCEGNYSFYQRSHMKKIHGKRHLLILNPLPGQQF
ncbi:hypothetical protein BDV96DRAFT_602092 [Lophiotrema nucula]|uniref:LysM domain-containing protein n=1 Tax=Lophiotrema nucula TaxID=690887 RepID=A0A6A5Z0X2_9PLEO|nr:hypothetical protein BDV96DRAFT_602092 [Lophiotrema nucula]